jgi:hypothetical protein
MTTFANDEIIPPPPADGEAIHDREYHVRAFRMTPDHIVIQGGVRDQKPPGLLVPDDPEPLTIHHMQITIEIEFPSLEILDVEVHFESHPSSMCPTITDHYGELVGQSIARGFTHRVRELFGGPRGCTHTTALLQAMAPVAVQCFWSMRTASARDAGETNGILAGAPDDDVWKLNINTCHVWAEDSDEVAARRAGAPAETPLFLAGRLAKLGTDPTSTA